jgi:hypothetical protein
MLRWLRGGRRVRELVCLGLCATVFVWFSYTSVFVIGAISLVFISYVVKEREGRDWRNVIAGLAFMGLAGSSAIWLYGVNIRPSLPVSQASGLQDFWSNGYPPLSHPWQIPLWLLEVHTGRGFAWPVGENHFGSTLTTVLWLTGLVIHWRRGNRWVWALLILPQVLSLTASFLHKYPYGANPRICMFLGPGICLFMGVGVQYLLGRFGHERRQRYYRVVALVLMIIAIGGAARDVVLRVREINGPGIRSTLVDAGGLVGTDGQFVVLNPMRLMKDSRRATTQVFAYYMSRYVAQRIWWNGEIPSQVRLGSNLAVLAVTTEASGLDSDPFGGFEKRFGKPMTQIWTQVARVPYKDKDRVIVRIYKIP